MQSFYSFLVAGALALIAPGVLAAEEIQDVLSEVARAANTTSYAGTLVYTRGSESKSMKIDRVVGEDGFQERIATLDGAQSEIFRTNKGVWCFFPERNEGFYKPSDEPLNRIFNVNFPSNKQIDELYLLTFLGRERVAGRWANRASLAAQDKYRYSLQIWIDEANGMVLRSDLLNHSSDVIDSYRFADIHVYGSAPQMPLTPTFSGKNYLWNFASASLMKDVKTHSMWGLNAVPAGFFKVKHVENSSSKSTSEKWVYSDGLASVMISVESFDESSENPNFQGSSQLGTVNAFGRMIDEHQITAMGEVPADTVYEFAQSVFRMN